MNEITNKTRWKVAAASAFSLGLTFLDQTAVNVALPSIQRHLSLSASMLHWVVNAYLLLLAVCLVLGGALGDRLGKKNIFISGILIFGISSVLCATSSSGNALVLSRALQGIGGALMIPNAIATTLALFPDNMRGKVTGTLLSFTSIFLILGPFVGGVITQYISWHAIFWLNVPVCLTGCVMMAYYCPKSPTNKTGSVDWRGFILLAIAIASIVSALMESVDIGWTSYWILAAFALGFLAFWIFIRYQQKATYPLIQLSLFKIGTFNRAAFIYAATQMVFILNVFIPIYLQRILGFSPTEAGAISIITLSPVMILSRFAGNMRDRHGPRLPLCLGLSFLAIGNAWLALSFLSNNIWLIFPGMLGFSLAGPFVYSTANTTALTCVPHQLRGSAAGITSCCRQLGATLGMAILGTVIISVNRHYPTNGSHGYVIALTAAAVITTAIATISLIIATKLPSQPTIADVKA